MTKHPITPKDFFLWAGAVITFYWSVLAFVFLIFNYIDFAFPNALMAYGYTNPYESGMPFQMASLIVLLPLSFALMHVIRRNEEADPTRATIWVRRWAILLTLFLSGTAIASDLITVLASFLSGEDMTIGFLLKVAVILLVASAVFMHFIAEFKGYWAKYPKRKLSIGIAVLALGALSIIAGLIIVGTPQEARRERFDAQKVRDLEDIQGRITYFWQMKRVLPASLTTLQDAVTMGDTVPVDPQSGASYDYTVTGPLSFTLCATFNAPSRTAPQTAAIPRQQGVSETWSHEAGKVCFERTIDPSFYPVKTAP